MAYLIFLPITLPGKCPLRDRTPCLVVGLQLERLVWTSYHPHPRSRLSSDRNQVWKTNFIERTKSSSFEYRIFQKRSCEVILISNLPVIAIAVTMSGEVTNAWVAAFASLRPVKLRLYDVTIVFFSPFFTSWRSHWPENIEWVNWVNPNT